MPNAKTNAYIKLLKFPLQITEGFLNEKVHERLYTWSSPFALYGDLIPK